jgi:hypothetical protein
MAATKSAHAPPSISILIKKIRPIDMYSILRIQYVHITPNSVVQYTPKYSVTGNIGSSARKQYSITGKVVIMASRIEQLNKKYDTSLLISEEVYNQLNNATQDDFTLLGSSKIKGSEKLVSLYKSYKE